VSTPADQIYLVEKGQNDGNDSWLTWEAGEWNWTDTVGNPAGSVNGQHYDLIQTAPYFHDCDFQYSNSPSSFTNYATCGDVPRYRHNNVSNMVFIDSHAKGMVRGSVSWYKNVYVPGVMPAPY
jgi:prepilin-type processing-associated H-X9-DG protein